MVLVDLFPAPHGVSQRGGAAALTSYQRLIAPRPKLISNRLKPLNAGGQDPVVIPGINLLPRPLATVIFHYSPTMDYRPEFTSMVSANSVEQQVRQLREIYGAEPQALSDVVLLAPQIR